MPRAGVYLGVTRTRCAAWMSAALATAWLLPAPRPAAAAAPPNASLPVLVGGNVNGVPSDPAGAAAAYGRLAAAGVRFARFDIRWSRVEPRPGVFDFGAVDAQVDSVRAAGLRVLGILDYGNPRYSTAARAASATPLAGGIPPFGVGAAETFPPDDPATFARFAGAVASHLRGRVMAYEIWNEENEGWRFWAPHEDAAAYARLLRLAHDAVARADRSVQVLFGGVFFPAVPPGLPGMAGDRFLAACYAADPHLGQVFDGVAYHPYPYPFTSPEYDAPVRGSVVAARDAMEAVLAAHGDGARPLWVTEVGWPTQAGYGVSREKQAEYLVRAAAASAAQGVAAFTWYTYADFPDRSGVDQEAAFGLFDARGSAKPAYTALRVMTSTLAGTSRARPRDDVRGADHAILAFGVGRRVTVLWNSPEGAATDQGAAPAASRVSVAAVPVGGSGTVSAVSMAGEAAPVGVASGMARVAVTTAPVYLVESATPAGAAPATVRAQSLGEATSGDALPDTTATGAGVSAPAAALSATIAALIRGRRRRARVAAVPRRGSRRG